MIQQFRAVGNSKMFLIPQAIGQRLIQAERVDFRVVRRSDNSYVYTAIEAGETKNQTMGTVKKVGRSYYFRIPAVIHKQYYTDAFTSYLFVETEADKIYEFIPVGENVYSKGVTTDLYPVLFKGMVIEVEQDNQVKRGVVISSERHHQTMISTIICLVNQKSATNSVETDFGFIHPGQPIPVDLATPLTILGDISKAELAQLFYQLFTILN